MVFPNESAFCIRWLKYWIFRFSISPSNEYSGLISYRMDWFDLLAVHGTLKSLLQHHSSKASILWCSAFCMVQLSHPYVTAGKTIALINRPLSAKWCLCFLICCLVSHSFSSKEPASFNFAIAVTICSDFGSQENKICQCFHFFPIYLSFQVMGLEAMILVFWVLRGFFLFVFVRVLSFKPAFPLSSLPLSRGSLLSLSAIGVISSAYLRLLIFLLAILIPGCDSSPVDTDNIFELFCRYWNPPPGGRS